MRGLAGDQSELPVEQQPIRATGVFPKNAHGALTVALGDAPAAREQEIAVRMPGRPFASTDLAVVNGGRLSFFGCRSKVKRKPGHEQPSQKRQIFEVHYGCFPGSNEFTF